MEKSIRVYNCISFNYTGIVDYMWRKGNEFTHEYIMHEPIHIHGRLDGDVVLGVDNVGQFGAPTYPVTSKLARAFIKPAFNTEYDLDRVTAAEQIIDQSDVICIYGMSLGISDKSWVDRISKWLMADKQHHLFYFQYSEDQFHSWNADEKMDEEDNRKINFLGGLFGRLEEIEEVYNRVHIPVGFDLFDIRDRLEEEGNRSS